ncbi:hypothetical protein [Pseudomonas phoenicis]|uniref:hypothetical protein n=1 Tax=unclassified Pseudomonas TaxID=196821 RepID=UPI0039A1D5DA
MPTENRSSNTEMVSFPRELSEELAELITAQARACGGGAREIWEAICAQFGQPAQQHQSMPIMLTAVATLTDDGDGGLAPSWLLEGGTAELFAGMTLLVADNAPDLCSEDGSAQVYTRDDPDELERLRKGVSKHWKVVCDQRAELETLRAQLAEAQALLRDIKFRLNGERWAHERGFIRRIEALSASAEPSAPVEIDERAAFEYHHRVWNLARDEDCPEDYRNPSIQDSWEGWQARAALERKQ